MKKRLLSGLLLLAMLLTLLPTMALADNNVVNYGIAIWPENKSNEDRINSENYTDFYGDGSVSYDPATKTLTLKNANVSKIWAYGVDLTLKLVGTNTVSQPSDPEGSIKAHGLTITGNGSLTVMNHSEGGTAIDLQEGNHHGVYRQKSGNVILRGRFLDMGGVEKLQLEGGTLTLE